MPNAPCTPNPQGIPRVRIGKDDPCLLLCGGVTSGRATWYFSEADARLLIEQTGLPPFDWQNPPFDWCVDRCVPGGSVDAVVGFCVDVRPLDTPPTSTRVCAVGWEGLEHSDFCAKACPEHTYATRTGRCVPCGVPNRQGRATAEDPYGNCIPACTAEETAYNTNPYGQRTEWICLPDCPVGQYRHPLSGLCQPLGAVPPGPPVPPGAPTTPAPPAPTESAAGPLLALAGIAAAVGGVWAWRSSTRRRR